MASKMQSVSFRNVDEFLSYLPQDQLKIVEILRKTIFECVPGIREKLSYNVPFYRLNRNILFIWPAAVLWGKTKTYEGVRLGFNQGYLIPDEISFLDRGNRKQVCYKDYLSPKEIDTDLLRTYIFEAVMIDGKIKFKSNGIQ